MNTPDTMPVRYRLVKKKQLNENSEMVTQLMLDS